MTSERSVYLDHAATTPIDPAVLAAMVAQLEAGAANPSSIHRAGRQALAALDRAREAVATVLGATPREIIFTASGSESDNLALKGIVRALRRAGRGAHLVVSAIEHHAVLHAAAALEREGCSVTTVPVDHDGLVDPAAVAAALRDDTLLVSVMLANNEIGTIQPIAEIAAHCRARGVLVHSDAVQAVGAVPINVDALGVDALTIAAHKFHGPPGIGALYVRRGTPLEPLVDGGGQERRRRAGTEPVAAAVGMALALQLAEQRREATAAHCRLLRDQLITGLLERIPDSWLNGHATRRLPNNVNLGFAAIEGESMLLLLDQAGIAASSGAACSAGSLEASHVLLALGLDERRALGSLRLSVGRSTSADDVQYVLARVPPIVARLRSFG